MGDTLCADYLAKDSVDQCVRGRVQLQHFEFRMLLNRVLVENLVEKRVCPLSGVAESQDN